MNEPEFLLTVRDGNWVLVEPNGEVTHVMADLRKVDSDWTINKVYFFAGVQLFAKIGWDIDSGVFPELDPNA